MIDRPGPHFRSLAGIAVVVLHLVACGDGRSVTGSRSPDVPVVIYLVDTLRADRLGVYGYDERETSPFLDELAASSVVFEQAYAPAPWTIPSIMSIHTSTLSCEHAVGNTRQALNASFVNLAQRMRGMGYYTGAYYANPIIGSSTGLDRGFDQFVGDFLPARKWAPDVDQHISDAGDRPAFLYMHTMEPHDVYWAPYSFIRIFGHVGIDTQKSIEKTLRRYNEAGQADFVARQPIGTTDNTAIQVEAMAELDRQRDTFDLLYDASVRWADANLESIVSVLQERGVWDKAIFIFMADHGEEIGDRGGWSHGQSVYEELARAPLVIHFPSDAHAGVRVQTPVSLIDVMPTIFDFLNAPGECEDCRGNSLLPLILEPAPPGDDVARLTAVRDQVPIYFRPWYESRGEVNAVVRKGRWKGIWNEGPARFELYDLEADPGELQDRSVDDFALAEALADVAQARLAECRKRARAPEDAPEMDAATRERLRALGYFD